MDEESDPETYAIIGAAMRVHRKLGPGFLEAVYQAALAREFTTRCIPFRREAPIPVYYDDEPLDCPYRADFLCYGKIIVELKAAGFMSNADEAQVINYLAATRLPFAIVLCFGERHLRIRRLGNTRRPERLEPPIEPERNGVADIQDPRPSP